MANKRARIGDIVLVTFLDHCEDGSEPIEFEAYGRLGKESEGYVCVDPWIHAKDRPKYDNNVKRFCILRGVMTRPIEVIRRGE